jgi:hypothetical protein
MFIFGRFIRNAKSMITYPFWVLSGRRGPDNHVYKKMRVRSVAALYSCDTFIETGTFYGQMVNAMKDCFDTVLSVELFDKLFALNKSSFSKYPRVRIYLGDSACRLQDMLNDARGRILFWLDGHYSGKGTACGDQVSPILRELEIIKHHFRCDHCILIDDARLFVGIDGYPSLEETKKKLLEVNPDYTISMDGDCLIALPPAGEKKSI